MECGYPRNNILVKDHSIYHYKIRKHFNLNKNIHIVLYAPTYRKGRKTDMYMVDYKTLFNALEKRFGGEWKVLVRLHPTMSDKDSELKYGENVINASKYDDMQEFMAGAL